MIDLAIIRPARCEHSIIHRREDRFAAWPFNRGMWKYPGDEIVVGFTSRLCRYEHGYEVHHGYYPDDGRPHTILARSTDGGHTWEETPFTALDDLQWKVRAGEPLPSEAPVDFLSSDVLLVHYGGGVAISTDRGHTFGTICALPLCRHARIMGRPDYVIRPDGACVLLSTVSVARSLLPSPGSRDAEVLGGLEGRPVAYITRNGAESWEFLAYLTPEPTEYAMIQPSGLWLPDGRIIAAVRCIMPGHGVSFWTEVYASEDGGRTWGFLSRLNDLGAPCHLLLLDDDRVLATYGYRSRPFGVRAKVSDDGGRTWGSEIILRDDGKSWDLGYPRSAQLDNGEIFTAYYFNALDDPIDMGGGVRYIAGTHWRVP